MKFDQLPLSDNVEDRRDGSEPVKRTLLEMLADAFRRVPPEAKLAKDAGVDDVDKAKG